MKGCCEGKSDEIVVLQKNQRHVLIIVLAINAIMFVVEFTAGILSRSSALLADSLDMLGDATVYAFSLYVIDKGAKWKAGGALLKGVIITAFGLVVLGEAIIKMFSDIVPTAQTMGIVGGVALAANSACLLLLTRHRNDDLNMRSTWICSRNDIVANIGVLVAAAAVSWTSSKWPDIAIGLLIALIFLQSAVPILKDSIRELNGTEELKN